MHAALLLRPPPLYPALAIAQCNPQASHERAPAGLLRKRLLQPTFAYCLHWRYCLCCAAAAAAAACAELHGLLYLLQCEWV
jgi:hypothetical protein